MPIPGEEITEQQVHIFVFVTDVLYFKSQGSDLSKLDHKAVGRDNGIKHICEQIVYAN